MKVWNKLSELLKNKKSSDFALIIGAGIHAMAQNASNSPDNYEDLQKLKAWRHFLESTLEIPLCFQGPCCPTLIFEMHCLNQANDRTWDNAAAKKRELLALKQVSKNVQKIEEYALKSPEAYEKLCKLCRSKHVSDIISLNIDLVCERVLEKKLQKPIGQQNIVRHRLVCEKRIWHPHGDRELAKEMAFGIRRYSNELQIIEETRSKFKARERRNKFDKSVEPLTWTDLFFNKHLIFIGTSLSESEWDIWFALINRFRNFARKENKSHQPETFILSVEGDHAHLPSRIQRLEAPSYQTGWTWLVELLG